MWSSSVGTATMQDSIVYDGWERVKFHTIMKNGAVIQRDSLTTDLMGNVAPFGSGMIKDLTTERVTSDHLGGGSSTYSYDRAGNLVQATIGGVQWIYGYDALNRMVSVRRAGTLIARYGYDVLGRRIAKRVYSTASGADTAYTRFIYHGSHVAFETDSAGTMGLKYTWGLDTDDLVGIRNGSNHYYVVQDKLRSIRALYTRSGTWQARFEYRPMARWWIAVARRLSRCAIAGLGASLMRRPGSTTSGLGITARGSSGSCRRTLQAMRVVPTCMPMQTGKLSKRPIRAGWRRRFPFEGTWAQATQPTSGSTGQAGVGMTGMGSRISRGCLQVLCANEAAQEGRQGGGRALTPQEKAGLGNMCETIECDKVHIHENYRPDAGITLGHDIFIGPNKKTGLIDGALLAHEMTHVGQYEDWGALTYYARAVWTQFKRIFADQYRYDLEPGKNFGDYGMEQQAQIVGNCFQFGGAACSVSPYQFPNRVTR